MNSSQFRSIVAPLLNEPFDGVYDMQDKQYEKFCIVQNGTPRSYHEEPVLYGFQQARQVPAGMPVPYQQGGQLFVKRYVYNVYGLAYAMTKVLVEDGDHIKLGRIFAKQAGNAMIETEETLAANVLNYSFNNSFPGGDGVSYINSAHPGGPGASTYSNLLTTPAALSQTSLEQMLIQIAYATDPTGKRINLKPDKLITGPSNMFQAGVLLKTPLRTGTNNNDLNMIQQDNRIPGGALTVSRVTSTTAWWVSISQASVPDGLKFLNRRKLEKSMEGDFITDSMRYKITRRFVVDFTDPLSLYGTPGL
jgi:hypothetical protein